MSTERKLFWIVAFVALALAWFHVACEKIVFVFNLRGVLVSSLSTPRAQSTKPGIRAAAPSIQKASRSITTRGAESFATALQSAMQTCGPVPFTGGAESWRLRESNTASVGWAYAAGPQRICSARPAVSPSNR